MLSLIYIYTCSCILFIEHIQKSVYYRVLYREESERALVDRGGTATLSSFTSHHASFILWRIIINDWTRHKHGYLHDTLPLPPRPKLPPPPTLLHAHHQVQSSRMHCIYKRQFASHSTSQNVSHSGGGVVLFACLLGDEDDEELHRIHYVFAQNIYVGFWFYMIVLKCV